MYVHVYIASEQGTRKENNCKQLCKDVHVSNNTPLPLPLFLPPHSLLAEYHALYELQRKRLEDQVSNLTFERDLWQQASYDLAQRVADECNLQTLQRIQLSEKSWCKLAGHFAVLLSDKDTQQVCVYTCMYVTYSVQTK